MEKKSISTSKNSFHAGNMQGLGIFSASQGSVLNFWWNIGRDWAILHSFWKVSFICTDLGGEFQLNSLAELNFLGISHTCKSCGCPCAGDLSKHLCFTWSSPSCRQGIQTFHNGLSGAQTHFCVSHTSTPPGFILLLFWAWTGWTPIPAAKTHSSWCQGVWQLLVLLFLRVCRCGAAKFQSIC